MGKYHIVVDIMFVKTSAILLKSNAGYVLKFGLRLVAAVLGLKAVFVRHVFTNVRLGTGM